jgi:hypothetical protein
VRNDLGKRDEGAIHDHEIDGLADPRALEAADVPTIVNMHAVVCSELPRQLPIANVHRVHCRDSALQQTVGEAAGRCPNIHGPASDHVETAGREAIERAAELHATARHVWMILPE